jgi:hypothetical protein
MGGNVWISMFQRAEKKCCWSMGKDSYKTGCGEYFYDGGESDTESLEECVRNWLSFCPYCGNRVEVKRSYADLA